VEQDEEGRGMSEVMKEGNFALVAIICGVLLVAFGHGLWQHDFQLIATSLIGFFSCILGATRL
jgi:hypothetical protein